MATGKVSSRRAPGATLVLVAAAAAALVGCTTPRSQPVPSGGGGSPADGPTGTIGLGDGGGAVGGCGAGTHLCSGSCVSDHEVGTCGIACDDPCPSVKGGTATCDGTRCGGSCPSGQKLCHGECIAEAVPCSGACPAGTHDCNGICSDNMSVKSCGATSCTSCAAPTGATATCDGNSCDFSCGAKKRCGDQCGECCTSNDCPTQSGQVVTCDQATHTCKASCPAGNKSCNGKCIPEANCCQDADCPATGGQVPKCDSGSGKCSASCAGATKPCNGACIPMAGCCQDTDCPGNFACVSNSCSTTTCRDGKPKAAEDCSNGRDDDCDGKVDCEDSDCAAGHACGTNKVCGGGKCNDCTEGASCPRSGCKKGITSCATGSAQCMDAGNAPDGTDCGSGHLCSGGACIPCGGTAQPCCPADSCPGGSCQSGICCPTGQHNCGGRCQTCCTAADCPAMAGSTPTCTGGACQYTANCVTGQPCGTQPDTQCRIFRTVCTGGAMTCQPMNLTGNCGQGPTCNSSSQLKKQDVCSAGICTSPTMTCQFGCANAKCTPMPTCGLEGQRCCDDFTCASPGLTCGDSANAPVDQLDNQNPATLKCVKCGGSNQICCGARSTSPSQFAAIRLPQKDRCSQSGFICPESESGDFCSPCGGEFEPCCLKGTECLVHTCKQGTCKCGFLGDPCCLSQPGNDSNGCFEGTCNFTTKTCG